MLGQAEDILGVLGNKTPVFLPVESLIAAARTNKWQMAQPQKLFFKVPFINMSTVLLSLLTNYKHAFADQKTPSYGSQLTNEGWPFVKHLTIQTTSSPLCSIFGCLFDHFCCTRQ